MSPARLPPRSTSITLRRKRARYSAAVRPAGPPPMIRQSTFNGVFIACRLVRRSKDNWQLGPWFPFRRRFSAKIWHRRQKAQPSTSQHRHMRLGDGESEPLAPTLPWKGRVGAKRRGGVTEHKQRRWVRRHCRFTPTRLPAPFGLATTSALQGEVGSKWLALEATFTVRGASRARHYETAEPVERP